MSGGVGAALADVLDGEEADAEALQAGLFDALDPEDTGALDAPSPLSRALTARAGRGRPKGSRNRRTEAVSAWLLSQHRHPLQVMMEAYSMSPAELAERIGLRKGVRIKKEGDVEVEVESDHYSNDVLLDILKLQVRMAEAVAPYVAQKLPQAVQIDARAGVTIAFEGVSLPARAPASGNSQAIEGEVMGVRLPVKSDE